MTSPVNDNKKNESTPNSAGAQYGHSSLSYNSYLKVPELKQLQFCQSNPAHHDEPLFIVIHQTYELWFKLILHEIDEVMKLLADSRVKRATHFLRRVVAIMKVLVNQIHILETMAPQDFLGFRNNLNPASGFQSTQFREIEIACGLKDKRLLEHFKNDEIAFPDLMRRYDAHTLQDAYYEVLKLNGFDLPGPYDVEESDPASIERQDVRIQSLRKLYEQSEKYGDLNDLAEVLIDIDEQLSLWRTNHVTVVERVIGFKRGTGGSEGVGYLRSTLHKRCFPDLWKVRSVLEVPQIECGP